MLFYRIVRKAFHGPQTGDYGVARFIWVERKASLGPISIHPTWKFRARNRVSVQKS